MLHYLYTENGTFTYILRGKQYIIGRKECGIVIPNDKSISRNHATLIVKNTNTTLTDNNSKYGTFVNGIKLKPKMEVILKHNDIVEFGVLTSKYTYKTIYFITTTSALKSNNKTELERKIEFLGGQMVQEWIPECTHVTVEQVTLTAKVLCALIKGIPVVTLKYWEDYCKFVRENLPPPNPNNYRPPISETVLDQDISLDFKEERKRIFENKVFVFSTSIEKFRMARLIKLAGGEVISWDRNPIPLQEIDKSCPEYIIIQATETDKIPDTLKDAIRHYNLTGKRIIPISEIALALMHCSCERDCNPNFDRKGSVFTVGTSEDIPNSQVILAKATQSSQSSISEASVKTEIIPNSINTVCYVNDIKDEFEVEDNLIKEDIDNKTSVKRNNNSEEGNVAKKFKNNPILSENDTEMNLFEFKCPRPTKSNSNRNRLFAFKNSNISECNGKAPDDEKDSNIFERKRKADSSEVIESSSKKKSNPVTPGPSTLNVIELINDSPEKQIPDTHIIPLASSTLMNLEQCSRQISSSDVATIDFSAIECGGGWLSKNDKFDAGEKSRTLCSKDDIDQQLQKYIESFNNTVVIRELPCTAKDVTVAVFSNGSSAIIGNKNFKKFKKVQPLHLQRRIIPEASYKRIAFDMRN